MDDLKRLIQKKSRKGSSGLMPYNAVSSSEAMVGSSGGDVSDTYIRETDPKRPRKRSKDRIHTHINVEQFILMGTGSIPVDIVLSREQGVVVERYMDELLLAHVIDGETDYGRINRCREAVIRKMDASRDIIHDKSRAPQNTETVTIDESWEALQRALTNATRVETFYKWLRVTFSTWLSKAKSESDELPQQVVYPRSKWGPNIFIQSCRQMGNLISDLEADLLTAKVTRSLNTIAETALNGDYIEAESEYMRIAVGNQTWLIGVGNCFIQERSSLDRIRDAKHIMNDERVRDYVQCIKRLLTISKQFT